MSKVNAGLVNSVRVMQKIDDARISWVKKNKKEISTTEFLELLLDNYTKDFTSEAERNAALLSECTGCTEEHCAVSMDETCAKTRKSTIINIPD